MQKALEHLKARLTVTETQWWTSFISRERAKREIWEGMTEDEYVEAGKSFDVSTLHFKPSTEDNELVDEEILRAESAILR